MYSEKINKILLLLASDACPEISLAPTHFFLDADVLREVRLLGPVIGFGFYEHQVLKGIECNTHPVNWLTYSSPPSFSK